MQRVPKHVSREAPSRKSECEDITHVWHVRRSELPHYLDEHASRIVPYRLLPVGNKVRHRLQHLWQLPILCAFRKRTHDADCCERDRSVHRVFALQLARVQELYRDVCMLSACSMIHRKGAL